MFDMLTRDELSHLHRTLCHAHMRLFDRIMGRQDLRPLVSVFSDEWALVNAFMDEISETAEAVFEEIGRRTAERTPTHA